MPHSPLHAPVLAWYDGNRRDLPWRRPDTSAWGVLVSELMLQQTPVARVVPVYLDWLDRWPEPADLAGATPGEAVRRWGRLGYPRRALRLHAAAAAVVADHGGRVPSSYDELVALPGVGAYTASAVASFAFGARHAVLDTNVRRVLARAVTGAAEPTAHLTTSERSFAESFVPDEAPVAAHWAVAAMELGALVCLARAPQCAACPIAAQCAWRRAGHPAPTGPRRGGQRFAGTDRQVRGLLLSVLRESPGPVRRVALDAVWADAEQRRRALSGLLDDGLVVLLGSDRFALPGE